jgi:hypothetical protein
MRFLGFWIGVKMKLAPVVVTETYEYPDPWPRSKGTCRAPHPDYGYPCYMEWPNHGPRHCDDGDHPTYWPFSSEEKQAITDAIIGGWLDPAGVAGLSS